jgi:CubicO group peptidase (beta-lactamase class C family)
MICTDMGLISPDDPVSKFFPEYSKLSYLDGDNIIPCNENLKISHLLTMTSGIPYANNFNKSVIASAKLFDEVISRQNSGKDMTTQEFCQKAADIPLMFNMGEKWDYGISADITGGIIEKASGMKYSDFLKKYIFSPLGMNDTDFYVPDDKRDRFSALYSWNDGKLVQDFGNYLGLTDYKNPPAFESGGAGLCSTIDDYAKFANMLTNKGEFNGRRIISEKSFDYMIFPKLSDKQNTLWDRLKGYNYGCFVRIMTNPEISEIRTGKGEFGWDGWTGTYFCSDAVTGITVLYFTQICGAGTTRQAAEISGIVYDKLVRNI